MTIAAAYLTSEGVVFGVDSATTVSPVNAPGQVLQLLNHAQKLFQVGNNSRFAFCSWGAGNIGRISHRTISARLSELPGFATFTVQQAMEGLVQVVMAARGAEQVDGLLGYFIGGWNLGTHDPQCFQVIFSPGQTPAVDQLGLGQGRFQGIPNFFTRVFHGYDPDMPGRLRTAVAEKFWLQQQQGLPQDFDARFAQAFNEAVAPLAAVGAEDMPIREAIDFVFSYIHITVKAHKFRFGPPLCGGPIEIGFISTDRPFRWALHKSFQTAMYEQEPTREYE